MFEGVMMKRYRNPPAFKRACTNAALMVGGGPPLDVSLASQDAWARFWSWTFRAPLTRLAVMSEQALARCQSLGAGAARAQLQTELSALPKTDSIRTILTNITPIHDIFMGEDFDPEDFVALLRLMVETFKTPPEGPHNLTNP